MSKKSNGKCLNEHQRCEIISKLSKTKQVLDIEDQLLYPEVQAEAEQTFNDLKKSFESFQSKIRAVSLKAKCKKLQNLCQMTIHDMFNQ